MSSLTDDEAIALVVLHGARWHESRNNLHNGYDGWAVWKGEEGARPWVELRRDTLGDACRFYCERHGLGQSDG